MESGSLAEALDRVDMMSGRLIYPGKDHPPPRDSGGGLGWWMRTIFFAALCGFVGAGIMVSSDTFSQIRVPNTVLDTSSASSNDLLVLAEPEHNRGVPGDFDKLADDADKKAEFSEGKGSHKGGKGTESEFGERMDVLPDPPPAPRVDVANAAADEAKRIKRTETHTDQGLFHTSEGMVLQHQQASSSMDVMPQARDDTWWKKAAAALGEELRSRAKTVETLFIGDSLFEAWHGTKEGGPDKEAAEVKRLVQQLYPAPQNMANGIAGDRTENILWRIYQQEGFAGLNAKVLCISAGSSDLSIGRNPQSVAYGVEAVIKALKMFMPQAEILLLAMLPRADDVLMAYEQRIILGPDGKALPPPPPPKSVPFANSTFYPKIKQVNARLMQVAQSDSSIHFVDCGAQFLVPGFASEFEIPLSLMSDMLHLTSVGHGKLASCLRDHLQSMESIVQMKTTPPPALRAPAAAAAAVQPAVARPSKAERRAAAAEAEASKKNKKDSKKGKGKKGL